MIHALQRVVNDLHHTRVALGPEGGIDFPKYVLEYYMYLTFVDLMQFINRILEVKEPVAEAEAEDHVMVYGGGA